MTSDTPILSPADLRTILTLLSTADIKVGQVPGVWPSVARLEAAAQSGDSYAAFYETPAAPAVPAQIDGNR